MANSIVPATMQVIEGKIAAIAEQSEDDFDRVMFVNAKGTFLCLKYEISHMVYDSGDQCFDVRRPCHVRSCENSLSAILLNESNVFISLIDVDVRRNYSGAFFGKLQSATSTLLSGANAAIQYLNFKLH
jgi:NAD(P)-dependent dehydrogenase (short-subunit alcohol dehydrogenase family)